MGDTGSIPNLEQQLRADIASDYLRDVVDGWPPLTGRQLADLAAIIAEIRPAVAA